MNEQQLVALRAALSEGGYWLGRAIGSAINVFNPSLVTIGGGLIEADKEMAGIADSAGPYAEAAFTEAKARVARSIGRSCGVESRPPCQRCRCPRRGHYGSARHEGMKHSVEPGRPAAFQYKSLTGPWVHS